MVSLTWSFDKTASTALTIARNVFLAANNDNVQPLAIVACERFGNTIAMCEDTCRKIETLTKTPDPVMIRFLRLYAGFDAADSATQLNRSQAGVQFLALAAALIGSLGDFIGAKNLHKMIESSATDKTLLPTVTQLKDLLRILGPRLVQSGFLDSVVGWQALLSHSPIILAEHNQFSGILPQSPGPDRLDNLVNAFRQLSRIGEADITRVSVYLLGCAAWVIAFTKWCLGAPPSVYLDDGKIIFQQPGSRVDVIIAAAEKPSSQIRVVVHSTVAAPSDLVQSGDGELWDGMVSVMQYGQWVLSQLNLGNETAKDALIQALPYVIRQTMRLLRFDKNAKQENQLAEDLKPLRMVPYPEEHVIYQTMAQLLDIPQGTIVRPVEHLCINNLLAVSLHLTNLESSYPCSRCCPDSPKTYG